MTLRLTHLRFAAATVVFATVSLAGPAAWAFTINTENTTNSDGSPRFVDPDEQIQNFGRGGSLFGQSGPSLQFGVQRPSDPTQGSAGGPLQPLGPRLLAPGNNN